MAIEKVFNKIFGELCDMKSIQVYENKTLKLQNYGPIFMIGLENQLYSMITKK